MSTTNTFKHHSSFTLHVERIMKSRPVFPGDLPQRGAVSPWNMPMFSKDARIFFISYDREIGYGEDKDTTLEKGYFQPPQPTPF